MKMKEQWQMELIDKMLFLYNHSENDSCRFTIWKIIENQEQIGKLPIQKVAELCHTSTATLTRTIQRLGCSSFSEFRHLLREEWRVFPYQEIVVSGSNRLSETEFLSSYYDASDAMQAEIRRVLTAEKIKVASEGAFYAKDVRLYTAFESNAEVGFQEILWATNHKASIVHNIVNQLADASNLESGTLCFITSPLNPDKAMNLKPLLDMIHSKNAKSYLLLNICDIETAQKADNCVMFQGTGAGIDNWFFQTFFEMVTLSYRIVFFGRHPNPEEGSEKPSASPGHC